MFDFAVFISFFISDIESGSCTFENSPFGSTISLKVDETGLWLLYCTKESQGLIILAKLDPATLDIRRRFQTNLRKVWLEEAFISCGILYGIRKFNDDEHVIKYSYNTHTQQSSTMNVKMIPTSKHRPIKTISSINFNPRFYKNDELSSLSAWTNDGTLWKFDLSYDFY